MGSCMVMPAHDAIRGEILRLADRDLDRYDFAREGARVLRRAVPFDAIAGVWFDPETGLPVDEWIDNSLAGGAGSRLPEIGLHETDIDCVQAARRLGPTGGQHERSDRRDPRTAAVGPAVWATSSGPCISATQACGAGTCCIANAELPTSRGGRWT